MNDIDLVMTCLLCQQPISDGYLGTCCTRATIIRLEALPILHRGLEPLLAPASGNSQGRRSKGGPAPLPVNEEILDLRGPGGIGGVAEGWVDAIRHSRRRPRSVPVGSIEGRLASAVSELIGHMPWVALSWPDAGEFARDIRDLTRSISSIIQPASPRERGTRVGNCPAAVDGNRICGAVLQLAPGESIVACDWCGTTYPPATWVGLKVLIDEDAKSRS
ncbi:hypothetical protein GCM10010387_22570 [Streptomyces inusitatus]|uniref:Uncharacterized protein n=1 Tax=Streptomyces inusitatus TaxID=68221 RepID=A0A918UR51_9ACTN|nr:hypothetical protein [Streptomyces inusitatus]GGZ28592.1 hypothetical protein GCM10010387_22570 [Streptomyces inusitatus]